MSNRFPMMIWWGDELINLYNDAYAVVLGKRHPEALGRSGRDVWAEIWPQIDAEVESVLRRGETTWNDRVHLLMHRNGFPEDTWFSWSYCPIRDESGAIVGLFNTCREDTAQVLGERAAEERRQQLVDDRARAILESITDAFFALDRDWRFSYTNAQCGRVLDRDPAGLLGKRLWDEYPGVIGSAFEPIYRAAMDDGVAGTITAFYPDLDSWYEVRTYPSPEGVSVYFRDVSEQKRADDALQASEGKFRLLADTITQLAWVANAEGWIHWYNRRWYDYTGTTPEQMEGWGWQSVHDPDELPRVLERWKHSIRSGEPFEMEFPLRRADGQFRWFLTRGVPLRNSEGQIESWFGTNTDIEDQRSVGEERARLLEAERSARAEAERASQLKDEFLATLSHELRTPLNAILGWSQIIARKPTTEDDLAEGLRVIERNARAQTQIIEDLLDMSRIISGKVRLDVQRVNLITVVEAAVDALRPAADAKGVRLQAVLDPLAGPVSGDPNRLQQVFWNLVSNAVKFTPRGGRVQVLLERVNSHLEISVVDTGEGIAPAFLPHAFDRFRQFDSSTTRQHGGLGLGLAIVKQLVELHGGNVRAKSAGEGKGSTFVVSLPLSALHAESAPSPARRHPSAENGQAAPEFCAQLKGVTVLVVDDDPDARSLVKRVLEDCNAVVTVAASAAEAFERMQTAPPDVLVSDIGMPAEDGYSLIRRVRTLPPERGGAVGAVALTAYARAEDRMNAVRAGFQHHVAKPVEPAELITMVASLVPRNGANRRNKD